MSNWILLAGVAILPPPPPPLLLQQQTADIKFHDPSWLHKIRYLSMATSHDQPLFWGIINKKLKSSAQEVLFNFNRQEDKHRQRNRVSSYGRRYDSFVTPKNFFLKQQDLGFHIPGKLGRSSRRPIDSTANHYITTTFLHKNQICVCRGSQR